MSGPKSNVATVVVRGPLASLKTPYAAELHELGYTPLGVVKQLRQVARLSGWLEQTGMDAADLSDDVLQQFLKVHRGAGVATSAAPGLSALLAVLRRRGAVVEAGEHVLGAAGDGLLDAFHHYLLAERGIGAARRIGTSSTRGDS